jgi:nicotinate phosphoribosyltransferase
MLNGYFENKVYEDTVVFDMFFRENACNGGYTIICGIEQLVEYVDNLKFTDSDIDYLRSLDKFSDGFLDFLRDFKFTGDIYAVEEGTVMFPGEPLITVKAPLYQAQFIETALLNIINFQSLIATKASRICRASDGDSVAEFGLRRAQGAYAGTYGARAAVIGGCDSTSNVLAGKMFDLPVSGTQAHSWIQKFDTELESFKAYAKIYPDSCLLLVDTYNVLESGVPNAIKVFKELRKNGHEPLGIRIDSGDLVELSKAAEMMLEEAGFKNLSIVASDSLDEYAISSLKEKGAKINSWGVGTRLITSADSPSLGGVYKLAATTQNGELIPKIKVSENPDKINNPGYKKVVRAYDEDGIAVEDFILLHDEIVDKLAFSILRNSAENCDLSTNKVSKNYTFRDLLKPLYIEGVSKYKKKTIIELKNNVKWELSSILDKYKRLYNPSEYNVRLSESLKELKDSLVGSKSK